MVQYLGNLHTKPFSYVLYLEYSLYCIENQDGELEYSNLNPATALQWAYDNLPAVGGTIFRRNATYNHGTTTINMNRDNIPIKIVDEFGVRTQYGGANYAFNINGRRQLLELDLLELTATTSKAIYMTHGSGSRIIINYLDGFDGSAGQHGIVIEATGSGDATYLAKIIIWQCRQLDDIIRLETTVGTSPYVNCNYVEIWEIGGTIGRALYINQYCRYNEIHVHSENGGVYCGGSLNYGRIYSACGVGKTGLEIPATGGSNHFTLIFVGDGTSVSNAGNKNSIFDIGGGYYLTNSELIQLTNVLFLLDPAGIAKANPNTNYVAIASTVYRTSWDGTVFRPSKCRCVVVAEGNEAGAGKGIAIIDGGAAQILCEVTWDGVGNAQRAGAWTAFPLKTNERWLEPRVKGSSATEDLTIYRIEMQLM